MLQHFFEPRVVVPKVGLQRLSLTAHRNPRQRADGLAGGDLWSIRFGVLEIARSAKIGKKPCGPLVLMRFDIVARP